MSYRVIGASAGTGKTHRLTSLVLDAFAAGALTPEALVGVTFTKKAAAELSERLQTRLYGAGEADLAQRLGMAYLGTVHSVGLRLLAEHAIEAGLSPAIGVLPDDNGRFLHGLLERVIAVERQRSLDELAWSLRINWDGRNREVDWHADVFAIVDIARMNRIGAAALGPMAARSWRTLAAHFDAPAAGDLDGALLAVLDAARDAITPADTTKDTRAFLDGFDARRRDIVDGLWEPWAKYARLDLGKPSRAERDRIRVAAARHLAHPRLHAELERYLAETFAVAADMLDAFAEWKAVAHVVDHTDQLDLAWQVLGRPEVAGELGPRLGLVVVDELQDSNPLQLALFTRLHALAGQSAWVGDPKQCIFEWNGADPALVDIVLATIRTTGGVVEQLDVNRRSRPELVALSSELFASAFAGHGVAAAEVRSTAHRADPPELAALPPLGLAFMSRSQDAAAALADIVATVLADPGRTPVFDRLTQQVRPVEPGDIAVLVATNSECRAIATSLATLGIPAATTRDKLLETAEGRAVLAGLTLVVAPDDALAEAELEALLAREGDGTAAASARDAWLTERLRAVRDNRHRAPGRWAQLVSPIRDQLAALSPRAALERVIEVLDLSRRVLGWPDGPARRGNLDALRALAGGYEALDTARARPLTVSAMLRAFAEVRAGDPEMPLTADQHVTSAGAVQVMTYHKSKGLEWPVVILGSLDKSSRRNAFDIACESDGAAFSLDDPLASRWVRYWPWPFLAMRTGELAERVERGGIGRAISEREQRERVRLLYVGFTRARDHLVLAIAENDKGARYTAWLDELAPHWDLTADAFVVRKLDGERLAVRTRRLGRARPEAVAWAQQTFVRGEVIDRPRRELSPSRANADDIARLGARSLAPRAPVVRLGEPLALTTPSGFQDWDRIGSALHGFLATDRGGPEVDRHARASAWLAAHDAAAFATPTLFSTAADRLAAFIAQRWPAARWQAEIPIACDVVDGGLERRVRGTIDLLLTSETRRVLIDHKSFPAKEAAWPKAEELAPQLALYAHSLARLPDARPLEVWIHFPIAGVVVQLA